MTDRLVPELPPAGQTLLVTTDAASEIDDLYAIALALFSPDRFDREGIVATPFAQKAGRDSIRQSYERLVELMRTAGAGNRLPHRSGGDPMRYMDEPSDSEGARFIIERAHAGGSDHPLWVVSLEADTELASAVLRDPSIAPRGRYGFHARSEESWPERNQPSEAADRRRGSLYKHRRLVLPQAGRVGMFRGADGPWRAVAAKRPEA